MMIYGHQDIDEYIIGMSFYAKGQYAAFFKELYNEIMIASQFRDWVVEKGGTLEEVTNKALKKKSKL